MGLPREMGLPVYLLPETVSVTHIHRGPHAGVDVLHVGLPDALVVPRGCRVPVTVGGPFAPPAMECTEKNDHDAVRPNRVRAGQLGYLSAVAERTTTAYAILEGIEQYEKTYFGPFSASARSRAPHLGRPELLRKSTTKQTTPTVCCGGVRRGGAAAGSRTRSIYGSPRRSTRSWGANWFRIYGLARREEDCDDLVRQMSAHSLVLYNIKAELHGLDSMLRTLRSSEHTGVLPHSPALRGHQVGDGVGFAEPLRLVPRGSRPRSRWRG